jgi:hypothetical protein
MTRPFRSILLALLPIAASLPAASVVFRAEPEFHGMELARRTCGPAGSVDGRDAWISAHDSVPGDPWLRGFFLDVTDPALRGGDAPAVEVDVLFHHPGNTAVELWANTADGFEKVASSWGNSRDWKPLHARIESPRFGEGGENPDLFVKAWAADFAVHSVVVSDASPANPANWAKSVSVASVDGGPSGLVAEPGPEASLALVATLRNANPVEVQGNLRWTLLTLMGKERGSGAVEASLPASADSGIPVTLPLHGLPADPYRVRLAFEAAEREGPADETLVAVATEEDAFVLFNRDPVLHGLDFRREAIQPKEMSSNGATVHYWEANGAHFGSDPWWNSVLLDVTSKRFQHGGRPVADIRIYKRHEPNAPIWLSADTAEGSVRIGSGWGNFPEWDLFYAWTDTARFARSPSDIDPKELPANGVDLRYGACSGPAQIRAAWVRGYPLDSDPDFHRLIRFDGLRADRDMFVFETGVSHPIRLAFRNLARVDFPARCSGVLSDDLDNPVETFEIRRTLAAGADDEIAIAFDATRLPQGVYRLAIEVRPDTDGDAAPILSRAVMLMASDRDPLPRARDGEFLYGVDPCNGFSDERFWKWADFMGADILRGFGCDQDDEDAMARATALHGRYGFRPYFFMDIAWHDDPDARHAENLRRAALAAAQARRYDPDGRAFWELGNEPDLTFFYPGPPEAYADGFATIARAIKEATPSAIVMNGGLCFAGEEGARRARRLVEILPLDLLDVWAYHGHGPGAAAERAAHNRLLEAARAADRPERPCAGTESGFAAFTPMQQRIQARTAVQKLVYAQSAGLKLFHWFRLLIGGGDANYSSLNGSLEEPRPVILAYRTTVRNLRHATHRASLSNALPAGAEAHWFADADARRHIVVAWSDNETTLRPLHLGEGASHPTRCDLFGNIAPLGFLSPGTVAVPLSPDPVFVRWNAPADAAPPSFAPTPLHLPLPLCLASDATDTFPITVENPSDKSMELRLDFVPGTESGIASVDAPAPFTVPAGGSARLDATVRTKAKAPDIRWPRRWRAFFNLPENADPTTLDHVPEIVEGVRGIEMEANAEGLLDLAEAGGGVREHAPVLLVAAITAAEDLAVNVGAAADWWMEWFVNGIRVYDTLENGNQGGRFTLADHVFPVTLRHGLNIVAVRVRSGSQGWKLLSGGPAELARYDRGDNPGSTLLVRLLDPDGRVLASEHAVLSWRRPVADASIAWEGTTPDLVFADDVENRFVGQPDATRWWSGPSDLSAGAWFRTDNRELIAILEVTDDTHRPTGADSGPAIDGASPGDAAWMVLDDKPVSPIRIARHREKTRYEFRVPASGKPDVSFLVADDDWGERKQTLRSPVEHLQIAIVP